MQNILIAGGSGLIGTRLTQLLLEKGYAVSYLSRHKFSKNNVAVYKWNPINNFIEEGAIENAHYIINLAGAGIAAKAWTNKRRHEIIDSRVYAAKTIFNVLQKNKYNVKGVVCASAIGYYKKDSNEVLTETSEPGTDFLSYTTQQWEHASKEFEKTGIRTTILRTGIVLSLKGGALAEMYKPMKFSIAAYFGNGKQIYSWIHIDDLCRMFIKAIEDEKMNGVYNAVAPQPETNKNFMRIVKKVKGGFNLLMPVPSILMRLILGERASVVLDGQNVSCKKISGSDFEFQFPDLKSALKNCVTP
jgi:hypothetical protein